MNAILNHIGFEFKCIIRDKSLLLMNYLFPIAFYLMMAVLMPSLNPYFKKSMVPGMILFTILVSTLLSLPNQIVSNKVKGIYRSYKIYYVPLKSVLLIPAFTQIIHITIVSLIIFFTGVIVFKADMPADLLGFTIMYFLVLIFFSGLGLLLGVCAPVEGISILIAQFIFIPSMIIGGIVVPTNILPEFIQKAAKILPTNYASILFDSAMNNRLTTIGTIIPIVILLSGLILSYILAFSLFSWDSKQSNQLKGLLGIIVFIPFLIGVLIL